MDEALEEYLNTLLGLMEKHDLEALRLEGPDLKVRMSKAAAEPDVGSPQATYPSQRRYAGNPSAGLGRRLEAGRDHLYELRSPLAGIFYRSNSPEAEPFALPGDYLKVGHVVCLIEAMKMFNEIHTERAGRLVEICVSNGDVVEADQVLMRLDTHVKPPEER